MKIAHFFDSNTSTFTYVVSDLKTKQCAIIDSVLDYDIYSGNASTHSADKVVSYVEEHRLNVEWILETHVHADHLTGAHYLKDKLGGKIGIGEHVKDVLGYWVPLFNIVNDTPLDGSQFDHLFKEGEIFYIGSMPVTVLYTPGHTPACVSYYMSDAIFVGDTIFMPTIGTARTDFPGGKAEILYDSISRILSLPDETKIYTCHDYPSKAGDEQFLSTVKEQKENNILINSKISKTEYVKIRNSRDEAKPVPKLLLPAIQVNLRCGTFGDSENNGIKYVKIPINKI